MRDNFAKIARAVVRGHCFRLWAAASGGVTGGRPGRGDRGGRTRPGGVVDFRSGRSRTDAEPEAALAAREGAPRRRGGYGRGLGSTGRPGAPREDLMSLYPTAGARIACE